MIFGFLSAFTYKQLHFEKIARLLSGANFPTQDELFVQGILKKINIQPTEIRRQTCSNNERYQKRKKKIKSRKIRATIVKIVAEKLQ